jgi:preprotein translocase subunit SecA
VDHINDRYSKFETLNNEEIQAKTGEFKNRYQNGETLDQLLPEAFALVKQACKRLMGQEFEVKGEKQVWNMIPYDVQLLGGIILHQGKIAEMKTGEGKTLVAAAPVYLNALSGKGVHVVTVNDYLASRDAQWIGYLYQWLGLTVGSVVKGTPLPRRREEYRKDITYVENSELGFDYLRDNLVQTMERRNLMWRPLNFAIVDEIDSILVDEARTPLIISEAREEATEKYTYYANIVHLLQPCSSKKKVSKGLLNELMNEDVKHQEEDGDYYIDEKTKTASLSGRGISKLEELLNVENIYKDMGFEEIHHIENALRAQAVYHRDIDYIVSGGEVLIVDEHTGRTMPGRRFSEGLHQAIEAKETVPIQRESQTMATITYQNFFKQYAKLAGMTGTAATEAEEFNKIYELEVVIVPTNKEVLRVDKNDKVYFDQQAKWKFVKEYIKFYHEI